MSLFSRGKRAASGSRGAAANSRAPQRAVSTTLGSAASNTGSAIPQSVTDNFNIPAIFGQPAGPSKNSPSKAPFNRLKSKASTQSLKEQPSPSDKPKTLRPPRSVHFQGDPNAFIEYREYIGPNSPYNISYYPPNMGPPSPKKVVAAPPSGSQSAQGARVSEAPELNVMAEPKLPSRKDASLKEFMSKMDDYAPIIPDAVTNYFLTRAGIAPPPATDPKLAHLLALATQKFISDIAADAYQYSRIRSSNSQANNPMGNLAGASGLPGAGPAGGEKDTGKRGGALGIQRPGYGGGGQGGGQGRTVLTMEDLGMAVGEYGVNVKRGEFYR